MNSHFSPSDRERDAVEGIVPGYFASEGSLLENPLTDADIAEPSDRWIDEALRRVPLPEGFLVRMSRLAQSAQPVVRAANSA